MSPPASAAAASEGGSSTPVPPEEEAEGAREEVRRAAAPPPGAAPYHPPSPPALHGAFIDRPAAGRAGLCPHRYGPARWEPLSPPSGPGDAVRAGGAGGLWGARIPTRRSPPPMGCPGAPLLHRSPVTWGSPRSLRGWKGSSSQRRPERGPGPKWPGWRRKGENHKREARGTVWAYCHGQSLLCLGAVDVETPSLLCAGFWGHPGCGTAAWVTVREDSVGSRVEGLGTWQSQGLLLVAAPSWRLAG